MYADHICKAARAMAENMAEASLPMYGSRLRLPARKAIIALLKEMRQLMFPAYFGDSALMTLEAKDYAALLLERIETNLTKQLSLALPGAETHRANEIARRVVEQLPQVQRQLLTDIDAIFDGDPAATSLDEIIIAYPGIFAIMVNRVAHVLFELGVPLIPRIMTEHAHSRTGIDIHPGATIGRYFFIDHGTGIVIGETTVIGDHVKIYQGVTLGALSTRGGQSLRGKRRHPTIEDRVTIYSGASVLGGDTVIGHDAVIGGNAFITSSIAPGTRVSVKSQELDMRPGKTSW